MIPFTTYSFKSTKFYGIFYRSTLSLSTKFDLLQNYQKNRSLKKLEKLIKILQDNYDTKLIKQRNSEWLKYFTQTKN